MSEVKLRIGKGIRLHFYVDVGCKGKYFQIHPANKDRVTLHVLNTLKWKMSLPEEGYLNEDEIVLEAVDVEEDVVKALKALMRIRGLKHGEVERLKKLPMRRLCRELILKNLIG